MTQVQRAVIIEDDKLNAKVLETLLRHEGMAVTIISDPTQALPQLILQDPPAVIFLDLEMPKLDGYEVLALLRAHYGDQLYVAAYTVHTNEMLTILAKGFNGFFAKPINGARFPENLRQILKGEQVLALE